MPSASLASLAQKILFSFLTEAFVKKLLVISLNALSKRTTNTLDDELVKTVTEALR